jgi:hypothetical protein
VRLSTTEDKPGGIELIDKDIDHTDRIVFAHIVIERLRKQSAMVAMRHLSFLPWTVFVITSTKQLASRKIQYDVASVNQDDIGETIRLVVYHRIAHLQRLGLVQPILHMWMRWHSAVGRAS